MMNQGKNEIVRKPPMVCGNCTSVLCDFQLRKCKGCKFVAKYMDRTNTIYFVAQHYDNKFRTFFTTPKETKRRVYQALESRFTFVEAQSLLNHYALAHNWRTCTESMGEK